MADVVYRITLDITLSDMTASELEDVGWETEWEDDAPTAKDCDPSDLAHLLKDAVSHPDFHTEMFAGSSVYVNVTDVAVVSASQQGGSQ